MKLKNLQIKVSSPLVLSEFDQALTTALSNLTSSAIFSITLFYQNLNKLSILFSTCLFWPLYGKLWG